MVNINSNQITEGLKARQSLTGFLSNKLEGVLIPQEDEKGNVQNGKCVRLIKFAALTTLTPLTAIASLSEAVVRNILLIIAKTLTFFVPKQWAKAIDNKMIIPMAIHAQRSSANAIDRFVKIFTNCLGRVKQQKVEGGINSAFRFLYTNKMAWGTSHFHFNGFSEYGFTPAKATSSVAMQALKATQTKFVAHTATPRLMAEHSMGTRAIVTHVRDARAEFAARQAAQAEAAARAAAAAAASGALVRRATAASPVVVTVVELAADVKAALSGAADGTRSLLRRLASAAQAAAQQATTTTSSGAARLALPAAEAKEEKDGRDTANFAGRPLTTAEENAVTAPSRPIRVQSDAKAAVALALAAVRAGAVSSLFQRK